MTRPALVLVVLALASAAAAQNPMKPGRWEVTMQMPAQKVTQCVTAEQLKEPNSALPQGPNDPASCKVSDYKTSGNTVSWKMACSGREAMTGSGEMTFNGDTYVGLMKMTTSRGDMAMKYSGKRLGDCVK